MAGWWRRYTVAADATTSFHVRASCRVTAGRHQIGLPPHHTKAGQNNANPGMLRRRRWLQQSSWAPCKTNRGAAAACLLPHRRPPRPLPVSDSVQRHRNTPVMAPATACPQILFAVFIVAVSHVYAQDPVCYGQQGVQTDKMFSCQPAAAESSCCAPGDICYSNGLCAPGPTENQDTATPFFWNGCTDPSFTSSACFSACFHCRPGWTLLYRAPIPNK